MARQNEKSCKIHNTRVLVAQGASRQSSTSMQSATLDSCYKIFIANIDIIPKLTISEYPHSQKSLPYMFFILVSI